MDLAWLFPYVLFLHVLGAIVAFGPTFAFPIIGAMGGKEPQYSNFATRVSATITDRMVIPLGIFQGVTGVLLIWISGRDLFASAWLLIAIVLYAFTLAYALTVQRATCTRSSSCRRNRRRPMPRVRRRVSWTRSERSSAVGFS